MYVGDDMLELEHLTGSALATPIFAGFTTGGLFTVKRGPRGAVLAGAIGAGLSSAYCIGGGYVYNVLIGKGGRF